MIGRYCIVPSTHKPNQNGDFMIRFFTEKTPKDVFENDDGSSLVTHNDDDKKKEVRIWVLLKNIFILF